MRHAPEQLEPLPDSRVLSKISSILFDLDGVILDSEAAHAQAWFDIATAYGIKNFSQTTYSEKFLGASDFSLAQAVFSNGPDSLNTIVKRKIQAFLSRLDQLNVCGDVVRFIKNHHTCFAMGIVSNCSRMEMTEILKTIKLDSLVDFQVTCDDVRNPKPAPDPYQKALSCLNQVASDAANVQHVLVIEDSALGAFAARAAGIHCVIQRPFKHPDVLTVLNTLSSFANEK